MGSVMVDLLLGHLHLVVQTVRVAGVEGCGQSAGKLLLETSSRMQCPARKRLLVSHSSIR